MEIRHRNRSLDYIIMNLWFMLALLYRLKHVKDSRHFKFLPEHLELSLYIAKFSDVVNQDH
jgi:hypothetical protein